jgi:GSCFA family
MKFRTELDTGESKMNLNHRDQIMFIGSCFSENISSHLKRYRFDVDNGAHGIIFHPNAIFRGLQQIIDATRFSEAELVKASHGWVSLAHHGSYHHETTSALIFRIQQDIHRSHTFLSNSKLLVLTFGTAMGYWHKDHQMIVANCHRLPQQHFEKKLCDLDGMMEAAQQTLEALLRFNPQLKIILTVSPVRHLREGFIENQRSKARLLMLCERLEALYECVNYFPSYEILLDELRDYRFYTEDMIHPNSQAINYIAEKFDRYILSEKALEACAKLEPHLKQSEHRSVHESIEAAEKRKAESENQIRLIIQKEYLV